MKSSKLFDLYGKVAVITGSARGLGKVMAEGLAEAGAKVVLLDMRKDELIKTEKEFLNKKFGVKGIVCDVTNEDQVVTAIKKTVSEFGSLDILINNAGITRASPISKFSLKNWNDVLSVNLTGMFLCSREASKYMIKAKRGKIINISSVYGLMADISPEIAYYTSKAGVIGFTRALAIELAPYNINVNAIAPGFFPTEMTRPFIEDLDALSHTLSRIPMKRINSPYELKGTVVFLASTASDGITGQIIVVDRGWTVWL